VNRRTCPEILAFAEGGGSVVIPPDTDSTFLSYAYLSQGCESPISAKFQETRLNKRRERLLDSFLALYRESEDEKDLKIAVN